MTFSLPLPSLLLKLPKVKASAFSSVSLPYGISFLKNENRKFDFSFFNAIRKRKRKFKSVFNAIEKRNTKMVVRIPFSNILGKQKTKNGSGNWNSVFQSRKKTKNENRTLNFVSQCCRKTENKNKSCISFFHAIEKRLALRYTHRCD